MTSRMVARVAASILFTGCAAVEITRVALDRPWQGFDAAASQVVSVALAGLWLGSAVVVGLGTRKAFYVFVLGCLGLVAHAIVTRSGGATLGLVYLATAPIVVLLERISVGRRLTWRRRDYEPEPPPGA